MAEFVKKIAKNDVIGGNHDNIKEVQPKLSPFQSEIVDEKYQTWNSGIINPFANPPFFSRESAPYDHQCLFDSTHLPAL